MSDTFVEDRKKEIAENKILIYGKGTKLMPMCGFSGSVVEMFRQIGHPFEMINVLENPEIRARLKEVTEWPTFPQIFIGGEFVGGCDIATEMFHSGELKSLTDTAFEASS